MCLDIFTTALLRQTVEYTADIAEKSCHKCVVLLQAKEEERLDGKQIKRIQFH